MDSSIKFVSCNEEWAAIDFKTQKVEFGDSRLDALFALIFEVTDSALIGESELPTHTHNYDGPLFAKHPDL